MNLNAVEKDLKTLYDNWEVGNEIENNPKYSSMFRMGFPTEYINGDKPLLMYVGQECLNCTEDKTQSWVREYQNVQRTKMRIKNDWFDNGTNRSPFWNFYRRLGDMNFNVLWNNLDKFHPTDKQRLSYEDSIKFNAAYGKENLSVLQREIDLLKPSVIVFVIGNGKYTASLASAFSIDEEKLKQYEPHTEKYVTEISGVLGLKNTLAFWTYHPAYLQRSKNYHNALEKIKTGALNG